MIHIIVFIVIIYHNDTIAITFVNPILKNKQTKKSFSMKMRELRFIIV